MKTNTRQRYNIRTISQLILIGLIGVISASCSTGIESTKTIKMTKEDVRMMEKSPEQKLAESVKGTPLSEWEKGKEFMAMSDRTLYLFDPSGLNEEDFSRPTIGKKLSFEGLESKLNPDLREECVVVFTDGNRTFRYKPGKTTEAALKETDSSKLPLISDLSLIDEWRKKIKGSTLWTKTNLWYDRTGNRMTGLKFAKVTVEDVVASTGDFPMKVRITGPEGEEAYLQMNYTSDHHDSRNFAAVFFLSDPKGKYPHITDEHWALIQRGKVGEGMTKEECKLSIGNPDEVRAGHNRSQTIDIWQYSDGTYLIFTDGLLTDYRQ